MLACEKLGLGQRVVYQEHAALWAVTPLVSGGPDGAKTPEAFACCPHPPERTQTSSKDEKQLV